MPQGDDIVGNGPQEFGDAVFSAAVSSEYNRKESPRQTVADAIQQKLTMEIWGQPAQGSSLPSVKAYRDSHLPLAQHGPREVKFTTSVAPTPGTGTPFEARWYEGTSGLLKKPAGFVAIPLTSLINLQP